MFFGGVNYALNEVAELVLIKSDNFLTSGSKLRGVHELTPQGFTEKASLETPFLGKKALGLPGSEARD